VFAFLILQPQIHLRLLLILLSSLVYFPTIFWQPFKMSSETSGKETVKYEVDPDGDLLLVVSDNQTTSHILVSSKVLCLVSPAFRAMLTGPFKESLDLKNKQGNEPAKQELPDDEPNGMLLLCSLLHFSQHDHLPQPIPSNVLLSFATVADKYGCTPSLRYVAQPLLASVDISTLASRYEMLQASYLLDIPSAFERFSKAVVLGEGRKVWLIEEMSCLPTRVPGI